MDLHQNIEAAFPKLSAKQQVVARYFLENEASVAVASVVEIAQRTGVNAATVVRCCQALGFKGFSDLQTAVRLSIPQYRTFVQKMEQDTNPAPGLEPLLHQVFRQDIDNLERTAANLDPREFEASVSLLCQASSILVVGAGVCAGAAFFLTSSLKLIGFPVREGMWGGIQLAADLASLTERDVVVGMAFWRYLRETVEWLRQARDQGVNVVAITDSAVSPLAAIAHHSLVVARQSPSYRLSITAAMSMANAIVAACALEKREQAIESLRRVNQLYSRGKLLLYE